MDIGSRRNGEVLQEDVDGLLDFIMEEEYEKGTTRKVFKLRGGDFKFSFNSDLIPDTDSQEDTQQLKALYSQSKVVKVACRYESGRLYGIRDNLKEWNIWCQAAHDPILKKWLCPVTDISDCGRYLMMLTCEPITYDDLPDQIPDFLKDVHLNNWGKLTYEGETRVVVLDYAGISSKYFDKDWGYVTYQGVMDEESHQ